MSKRKLDDYSIKEKKPKKQQEKKIINIVVIQQGTNDIFKNIIQAIYNKQSYYLNGSQILDIIDFPTEFGMIKILDLNSNNLFDIPKCIFEMKNLTQFEVAHNEISSIDKKFFGLKKLAIINFSSNKFKEIPPEIAQLENLMEINFNSNQIKNIPVGIEKLENLSIINLKDNKIEDLLPLIPLIEKINQNGKRKITKIKQYNRSNSFLSRKCSEYEEYNNKNKHLFLNSNLISSIPAKLLSLMIQTDWYLHLNNNLISNYPQFIDGQLNIKLNGNPLSEFFPSFMQYYDMLRFHGPIIDMDFDMNDEYEDPENSQSAKSAIVCFEGGYYELAYNLFNQDIRLNPSNIKSYRNRIPVLRRLLYERDGIAINDKMIKEKLDEYFIKNPTVSPNQIQDKPFLALQWQCIDKEKDLIHKFASKRYKGGNDTKFHESILSNFTWTKSSHPFASVETRKIIKTLLMLNLKNKLTNLPRFPEALIHTLPKEILIEIFLYLPFYGNFKPFYSL